MSCYLGSLQEKFEAKDLYPKLWYEDIIFATYVQNRYPHKALEEKTPFKAWSGHKPNISHFKVFGSKSWARITPKKRNDLQPQRKESIMVGYSED